MIIKSRVNPDLILCSYVANVETESRGSLTASTEALQVSVIPLKSGARTEPHAHLPLVRNTTNTQECWVVLSGEVLVTIYDIDDSFLTTVMLFENSVFVTFAGGHSLLAQKDSKMIEIKNGPYLGKESDYRIINVQG